MMAKNFTQIVDELKNRTLAGAGETDAALRQEIAAYAAAPAPGNQAIPRNILPYISKVAMHSYKVTDMDINQLKAAGYSEDELYELTVSAAFGAGLARLNHGLALLDDQE